MAYREFKYTADEEEPDCMRCENLKQDTKDENGDDYCYACCGPAHFWNGYVRWEEVRS